jgi:hypothetical protein
VAILALVALVGGACSAGGDEAQEQHENAEPSATARDPEQHASMTLDMDTQVARAVKLGESHVRVDFLSRAGEPLFSVDFRSGVTEGETVTWQLHEVTATEPPVREGGLPVPLEALPELKDAIKMAILVQDRVVTSMNGQDYDNWGCNLPFTNIVSCGPHGGCCDIHDQCYADNGCDASSWYKPWPFTSAACVGCNAAVVGCMGLLTFLAPGPSVCCELDNCGDPR